MSTRRAVYVFFLVVWFAGLSSFQGVVLAGDSTETRWSISDGESGSRTLNFRLPDLQLHEVQAGGQTWQLLDIEGTTVHGATGEPGVPVASRLVAVPAGMTLRVSLVSALKSDLPNLKLLPLQDPDAESFAYSSAAYSRSASLQEGEPRIEVGRPAILAGQTVVPVTIHAVSYDPAAQQASLWTEVTLKLDFVPDPEAPLASVSHRSVPQSFARQLSRQVLGYQADAGKAADLTGSGLGTYVAVHSGHPNVVAGIAPLLQWRREQGYHVVEINTSISGGTNTVIKTALQNIYNDESIPPLEFITIIGDVGGDFSVPAWTENLSGYGGGGDHYYAMLDGDDILADVHIGRVSVRTMDELTAVIAKILGYEQTPPMDNTDWFGRACLQGDPSSSGITTIYTNQWVKGQLQALGWAHVDTTWSGNFATQMLTSVGQGGSAYGYRGYLGTSGINNGHVESLTNGLRLPMALLPTCASGSFVSNSTARSEAWLRAPNGGAVAAVGTATIGTHTRYNNCYYLGTWDELLNGGDHRIGVAHTAGKVALYSGYYLAEPDRAEIWAMWNNVMGDGATEMWTGVPEALTVTHPTQISFGAQAVTIDVALADQPGPLAGTRVSLFQETSGFQVSALTDASGQVTLNLPDLPAGSITVTVTGHDLLPYRSGMNVGQVDVFCSASGRVLDDGGDLVLNPGEVAALTPLLTNHGTSDAFNVSTELTVLSGPASLTDGSLTFGTIGAGTEVAATTEATLTISSKAQEGDIIRLLLTTTDGLNTWTSLLEETVAAPAFSVSDVDLLDFEGSIDPGESGRFVLTLENLGSQDASSVQAYLTCDNPWVTITHELGTFGSLPSGGSATNYLSAFGLSVSPSCFGGTMIVLDLAVEYAGGLTGAAHLAVTIGGATTDQPTGPDAFGYYAVDNTDLTSDLAPVYDWVAIDPDHGGLGTDLGLTDFGWEQDDTQTMALPFGFSFYGVEYDQVSICSNGWLAMGETPVVFYRNFPLPASHSPGAMIAPFWDNLNQTGNKKVYTWYDELEHRFIIQWYEMPNHYSGATQNFEVILLDPAHHPTATGDGMILFQYEEVHNTDARDGFATVGIQNADRTVGLNYTYWNQYAPGAAPLAAGRAILFGPIGDILLPSAAVTPAAIAQTLAPDGQSTEYLHIANNGDEGSVLEFSLQVEDPALLTMAKVGSGGQDHQVEPSSLAGSTVTSTTMDYLPGSTMNVPLDIYCSSPDDEWLERVHLDMPVGVTVNSATNVVPASNGEIIWNGEIGNGIQTTWGSDGGPFLSNGNTGSATINLTFSPDLQGEVVIPWTVFGDEFGGLPHQVSGELVLASQGPAISVSSPTAGQLVQLGHDLPIAFLATDGPELVNIDLQRELSGPWTSLATDVPFDATPWVWTVNGEPGDYAVIRVSDAADAAVFGTSGVFQVGRNLDWVQPAVTSGVVLFGQTFDLAVVLDATGLAPGLHQANLVVSTNGGAPFTVPLNLTVTGPSAVGDLPSTLTLLGNYPNPFNPQTMISFSLPADQDLSLGVYSVRGRLVRSLLQGRQAAGVHRVLWNGQDSRGQAVASGVYFYRLETGGQVLTGKMMLTK
jgi:hypothetical protein|nr:C25 family cysteine peptidase [Candidatus Krumholzibacteria bacterium]